MRPLRLLAALVLFVAASDPRGGAVEAQSRESAQARQVTVIIKDRAYSPKLVELRAGDSVVWVNEDTVPHTATSDGQSGARFDTGRLGKGALSKPVAFDREGEVPYHCEIHGQKMMSGKIVVKAAKGKSATP